MSDFKKFRKLMEAIEDISESSEMIQANDTFHFELGEDLLIETGVVAVGEDAIIVHADQQTLDILREHFILEDFEELTEAEVIAFPSAKRAAMPTPMGQITGKVYGFEKPEDLYADFEKSKDYPGNIPREKWLQAAMRFVANKKKTNDMNTIKSLAAELYDQYLQLDEELDKIMKYSGLDSPAHLRQKSKDWKDPTGNDPTPAWKRKLDSIAGGRASAELDALDDPSRTDEDDSTSITPNQTPVQNASDYQTKRKALQGLIGTTTDSNKKAEMQSKLASLDAEADKKGFATQTESKYPHVSMRMGSDSDATTAGSFKMGESEELDEANPDWNKIAMGIKGKDPDAVPLPKAEKGGTGPVMSFPNIYKYVVKHIKNSSFRLTDDPPSEIDDALKKLNIKITGKKRQDLINRVIQKMEDDGTINDLYDGPIYEDSMDEAKYHGREVPLGKKMKGDVKKSKVYVRKPNGKVVKVNFGDKNMRIKKNSPAHRKSFRARHHCESPGPRWKARYWSCKSW